MIGRLSTRTRPGISIETGCSASAFPGWLEGSEQAIEEPLHRRLMEREAVA